MCFGFLSMRKKDSSNMLSHKMVPKYMKDFEKKCNVGNYRHDENKCIASGQKALVNFHRVSKDPPPPSYKHGYCTLLFYFLRKHEPQAEPQPEEKEEEKCIGEESIPNKNAMHARDINRKKETSL